MLSIRQYATMKSEHSPIGQAVTDLVLSVFRLNGALLAAGDTLVRDLGLTSARWQVLGAIALEGTPLTVAQIARRMGLARQSVQRVANDLGALGLLAFRDNPDHRRAKLLSLTEKGSAVYAEAETRQIAWANTLGKGLDRASVSQAIAVTNSVHDHCQSAAGAINPSKGE